MISIIISSINKANLAAISSNIKETIGTAYEIIAIENSEGRKGICEVYNLGVQRAKYDILCFMHEDIAIHTSNWGEIVSSTFKNNPNLGLIGIAGSQYKSLAPSGWHCYDIDADIQHYNIVQHYKFSTREKTLEYSNPTDTNLAFVACIDGVWFCLTREAAEFYSFDAQMLKGFHGYDLDLSLGINQKYKVGITFEILIAHFSEGNFNKAWLREILKVHAKWSSQLPLNLANLPQNKILKDEKKAFKNIFARMWNEGFKLSELFEMLWKSKTSKLMSPLLFFKLNKHLLKYLFKRRQLS